MTEKRNSDELETNRERLGRPSDKDDTAERLAERFLRDFDAEYRRRLKEGEERSAGLTKKRSQTKVEAGNQV